jgi:hypothetical protein
MLGRVPTDAILRRSWHRPPNITRIQRLCTASFHHIPSAIHSNFTSIELQGEICGTVSSRKTAQCLLAVILSAPSHHHLQPQITLCKDVLLHTPPSILLTHVRLPRPKHRSHLHNP